jgi:hypothetical protein
MGRQVLRKGASQMCKNLDSPHPLTPSPKHGRRGTRIMSPLLPNMGEGELELCLPSPKHGRRGTRIMSPLSQTWERGWGVRDKDLSLHWDAPPSQD